MTPGLRLQWRQAVNSETGAFLTIIGLATLVRLILMRSPGYFGDVQNFVNWGVLLNHHFQDFYSYGRSTVPIPDYPPLAMYMFGLLTYLYTLAGGHLATVQPGLLLFSSWKFSMYIKTPVLLADLGSIATIYALGRRVLPSKQVLLLTATYAFSPTVLLEGALWGQIDTVFVFSLLTSCLFALQGRGLWAGISFAIAQMIKPQPIVFLPLLLVFILRHFGWKETLRLVSGIAIGSSIICLPYILPPHLQLLDFVTDTKIWLNLDPQASISAYNLWWFLGLQTKNVSTPFVGSLTLGTFSWLLFLVTLLVVLVGLWIDPSPRRLLAGFGVTAISFFVLTTLERERYLYPALAFLLVASFFHRRFFWLYAVATITNMANMMLVLIGNPAAYTQLHAVDTWRSYFAAHPEYAVIISACNVLLLLASLFIYSFLVMQPPVQGHVAIEGYGDNNEKRLPIIKSGIRSASGCAPSDLSCFSSVPQVPRWPGAIHARCVVPCVRSTTMRHDTI